MPLTMPEDIATLIRSHWDIPGLLSDLREKEWISIEGRVERMVWIGSIQAIDRSAKESVTEEEWKAAAEEGFEHEIVQDYLEVLSSVLSEEMGTPVYTHYEGGEVFIVQYQDETPTSRKDWDPRRDGGSLGAIELIELGQPRKKKRIPYTRGLQIAKQIQREISSKCTPAEMILVGSLRRKRPEIADVEFVVLPEGSVEEFSDCLAARGYAVGGKLRKGTKIVRGVKIEIYIAHAPEELGALIFMYTGDFQFNIAMRRKAKMRGLRLNQYGIWDQDGNPVLQSPDERDFFEFLEVDYHTPEERSVATRTPAEKRQRAKKKTPSKKRRKRRSLKRNKGPRMRGMDPEFFSRINEIWED